MSDLFRRFSISCSNGVGSYWAFLLAMLLVLAWVISGPFFDYSDTWQLLINTVTSITTFIMVFLIQSSQNREAKATQLKLDELIRALDGARTKMVNIENLCDEDLQRLRNEFEKIGESTGMEGANPATVGNNKT